MIFYLLYRGAHAAFLSEHPEYQVLQLRWEWVLVVYVSEVAQLVIFADHIVPVIASFSLAKGEETADHGKKKDSKRKDVNFFSIISL